MKINTKPLRSAMTFVGIMAVQIASAQCPAITCPGNQTVNNTPGTCGAAVTYVTPVGTNPCNPTTFAYTGAAQTYTVPTGVTLVTLDVYGAEGIGMNNFTPGQGGRATGNLVVTPGQVLNIYVGGQALWNGGGSGRGGANGGDASDVRVGGAALANRVIVAGGGGGAGGDNWGCFSGNGDGGGGTAVGANFVGGGGGSGYSFCGVNGANTGGTSGAAFHGGGGGGGGFISGGAPANANGGGGIASPGVLGIGGASNNSNQCGATGGGGGGYYGGGGAAGTNCGAGQGGGGSSWTGTLTSPSFVAGARNGNGQIVVTPVLISQPFAYTGALQTFTVPAGVTSVKIKAYGAKGEGGNGGNGGYATGDLVVTPGQVLNIYVGGQAGYNGGGIGHAVSSRNGGGATDVRVGGVALADRKIVAGGGGSSSGDSNFPGGAGGGGTAVGTNFVGGAGGSGYGGAGSPGATNGGAGNTSCHSGGAGGGGLNTGGAGSCNTCYGNTCGMAGVLGIGGNGDNWENGICYNVYGGTSGGGGGYYGGGGTSVGNCGGGGGGGGSSWTGTLTNPAFAAGVQTGNGQLIVSYIPAVSTTQTAGLASGATFPVGTTVNTFQVNDGFGNTTSCSFNVVVVDNEAPAISCPGNIAANTDLGVCGAVVNFNAPVGTDNCLSTTALTAGLASGSLFPVGVTTETYTVTDASGLTSTCSFTVTVTDNQAPAITCPGNMSVNTDLGVCGAVVNFNSPVGTDNCFSTTVRTVGMASGSTFPVGVTTQTYVVTDASGATATCSFTITVTDNEAPAITCPGNIIVNNAAGLCEAVVTFNPPAGTDNCSATTVQTAGLPSGSTFPVGVTTQSYTATDAAGNASSCSFTVTVVDNELPTIGCPANVATCNPLVTGIAPTSTNDNCVGTTVAYALTGATTGNGNTDASGTTFNVGTTSVMYTVTDAAGNTNNCAFNVVIHPTPVVVLSAFANDTICEGDAAVVLPNATPVGGTFSGAGVVGGNFNPATAGTGNHYVVYSSTNGNGCTDIDSTMITVVVCAGINDGSNGSSIVVYPNPTSGMITINLGSMSKSIEVTVMELNGALVKSEKYSNSNNVRMDISDLSTGMYFITVKADNQLKQVKIVKN